MHQLIQMLQPCFVSKLRLLQYGFVIKAIKHRHFVQEQNALVSMLYSRRQCAFDLTELKIFTVFGAQSLISSVKKSPFIFL